MEIERLFDLGVKILAGFLVVLTFKGKIYPPMCNFFNDRFFKPHDELNSRCDEHEKTQKILIAGQLALLHDQVYQACRRYIDQGCIDVDDLKNLEHLYEAYTVMGGNGTCKQLYGRVCELDYKKEE